MPGSNNEFVAELGGPVQPASHLTQLSSPIQSVGTALCGILKSAWLNAQRIIHLALSSSAVGLSDLCYLEMRPVLVIPRPVLAAELGCMRLPHAGPWCCPAESARGLSDRVGESQGFGVELLVYQMKQPASGPELSSTGCLHYLSGCVRSGRNGSHFGLNPRGQRACK